MARSPLPILVSIRVTLTVAATFFAPYAALAAPDSSVNSGVDSGVAVWPTHRHDAGRTAASPHSLAAELHLQWTRKLPAPRPAFPGELRMRFDATYEPIAAEGLLFVPSMITDTVTAYDTKTGAERWRYIADGPVRFAPVYGEERIYFVSDDGYLYCLSAADGKLIWKFRGLPADRKERRIIGNERLISLWPARGGPLLVDNVIYFAAGIWPADGVFVYALDAATGRVIWENLDSHMIANANLDHGISQDAGLTPQGYLTMVDGQLVVPCGAQLPAFIDPATGKLTRPYTMGWGGREGLPKGTYFVAGAGQYLSHSGDLYDIRRPNDETFGNPRGNDYKSLLYPGAFTRLLIDTANQKDLGEFNRPVFAGNVMIDHDGGLVAYDLSSVQVVNRADVPVPDTRKNDRYPDRLVGQFDVRWRLPGDWQPQIVAGSRLYATNGKTIAAVDMPSDPGDGGEARISWRTQIDGTPYRLLAADGRLFVVTLEGSIHAFGAKKTELIVHETPQGRDTSVSREHGERVKRLAQNILDQSNVNEGYALVLGLTDGALVEQLLDQSFLYVIAVDPDAAVIDALRQRLHDAGLYGLRAMAFVGDPLSFPLPPYMASLIVSEDRADLRAANLRQFARQLIHPIRPYGGVALLSVEAERRDTLRQQLAEARIEGAETRIAGDFVAFGRPGPLPGADNWSHDDANAANAGASDDRFIKAPLGMLWFGGSDRWHKARGTVTVRVAGGRTIVLDDGLHAIDVFTGRRMWDAPLPFTTDPNTQFVALDDAIYLSDQRTCYAFDARTGMLVRRFELPDEAKRPWTNLRVRDERVLGTSGDLVVCFDRATGRLLWQKQMQRDTLSIAVGADRVFIGEMSNARRGETPEGARTLCLDLNSGNLIWQAAGGADVRYAESLDMLVTARGVYRAADGAMLRETDVPRPFDVRKNQKGGPRLDDTVNDETARIVGDKLLVGRTDTFTLFDLSDGSAETDEVNWIRRGCTELRASTNLITTRYKANAAYVDLQSQNISPIWNVRSACGARNNLYPADGVLNMPNITLGCTCNYTPTSQAFVPHSVIDRGEAAPSP